MDKIIEGGLSWKIPGGVQGKAKVVVAVKDNKSNVVRHSFSIVFE